jgi:diguanylate cyclase (GGDEF)-like protein
MTDLTAARPAWTGARLRGAPRALLFALLGVETLAAGLSALAVVNAGSTGSSWLRLGLLLALCVGFEEFSLHVSRLRLMVRGVLFADMTSVWVFAGVLVLPGGYAVTLAALIGCHTALRRDRINSSPLYRRAYTTSTWMLSCLAAGYVREAVERQSLVVPSWLLGLAAIVAAALAYTLLSRSLIILAVRLSSSSEVRLSLGMLIGTWSENGIELSTLCLGAMTGVVVLHQAAVAILALLPMGLLQRGALVKELETAASVDAKTGLLNAATWQHAAEREAAKADREEVPAAVLLIDLDHFKAVNDTYGHLSGDNALRLVGLRLTAEFRQSDVVGRFGGEEFVAFLPRLGLVEAQAVAERIRRAVNSITLDQFVDNPPPEGLSGRSLSASIGLAMRPTHGSEVDELLRAADSALYAAKHAGRNRVVVAGAGGNSDETIPATVG